MPQFFSYEYHYKNSFEAWRPHVVWMILIIWMTTGNISIEHQYKEYTAMMNGSLFSNGKTG